jgi:hypothetical protein
VIEEIANSSGDPFKLNFLDNCILESLRLVSHSIGSMRKLRTDYTFKLNDKEITIQKVVPSKLSYYREAMLVHLTYWLLWMKDSGKIPKFSIRTDLKPKRSPQNLILFLVEGYIHVQVFILFQIIIILGKQVALLMIKLVLMELFSRFDINIIGKLPQRVFDRATLAQFGVKFQI